MVPPTAFPSKEQNLVKKRSQGKTMNGNTKKSDACWTNRIKAKFLHMYVISSLK